MQGLRILVDMDDTIEDLAGAWIAYLNNRFGTDVHKSDIVEWDITKAFPTIEKHEIYDALKEDALWDTVKPISGAVKYLKKLIDDGNQVVIVTASHPDSVSAKLNKVLFRYFPYFTYQDVIIASKKQLIMGDVLIDDALHNMGGNYLGMLFTAPHNKSISDFELEKLNAIRVDNWKEVYELLHARRLATENKK